MNKIYFLFTFIFIAAFADAQPTLTAANNNPVNGLTFDRKAFTPDPGQEGAAGANQTWDWSSAVEELAAAGEYISPSGTAHAAAHPTATSCLVMAGATEYEEGNNTGLYRLAFYNPGSQTDQVFDVPTKIISYPFSLNSTYSTSYHASVTGPGFSGTQSGTMTVTADGWGTLITPTGTFTNVLRIHTSVQEVYDYGALGIFNQTADQYIYCAPNVHYPVGIVTWGEQDGNPFSGANWSTSTVGINEVNAALYKLSVYPNPANELSSFSYTLTKTSAVSVTIMDQAGRIVQKSGEEMMQPGMHTLDFDVANLSEGIYFIQTIIDNEIFSKKLMVKH